jgi:hypothetical protein
MEEKKNLFIIFDFPNWHAARSWSYVGGFQIIYNIMKIQKMDSHVLIISVENSEITTKMVIERNIQQDKYQNIIIWYSHLKLDIELLEKLAKRCENMIFVLTESLLYNEIEIEENPSLALRKHDFISKVDKASTIISLCPETDKYLKSKNYNSLFFYGFGLDIEENMSIFKGDQKNNKAYAFAGKIYNEERKLIRNKVIELIVPWDYSEKIIKDSKIKTHIFQFLFIILRLIDMLFTKKQIINPRRFVYYRNLISKFILILRKKIWRDFIKSLASIDLVISLPSYYKGLPGRFFEAILAGCRMIVFVRQNSGLEGYLEKFEPVVYVESSLKINLKKLENWILKSNNEKFFNRKNLNDYLLTSQDLLIAFESEDIFSKLQEIQKTKSIENDT